MAYENTNLTIARGWHVTIDEGTRGVVFTRGRLSGELEAGRHRRRSHDSVHVVDTRPSILTVPPQEVLTADGVQVRLSLVATITVVDATAWVTTTASPYDVVYTALQVALRDRVAATELTDVASSRSTLLAGLDAELAASVAPIGATVTNVRVKDITLPSEVRSAVAQVALAKQRGLADLERARSEAASLRSLTNTAKLMAEHPELLQLRTLQAAVEGAQVIIHRGDGENTR